jgi:hypothetical protein
MEKESKRGVKPKTSPPKYVSGDDELDSSDEQPEDEEAFQDDISKNPKEGIKGLLSQVGLCDEILEQ